MKRVILLIVLFSLWGCAYFSYFGNQSLDIPNFYKIDDCLLRGGQPKEKGFNSLKSMGVKTILSLRGQNEELLREKELAQNLGMNFYNIPMSVYKQPSNEQITEFLGIVSDKSNLPVFVHCESGRDRTGAIVALYRVAIYGWGPKEAYKEAKKFGFWPYKGDAELKKFIHQLKDKRKYFKIE